MRLFRRERVRLVGFLCLAAGLVVIHQLAIYSPRSETFGIRLPESHAGSRIISAHSASDVVAGSAAGAESAAGRTSLPETTPASSRPAAAERVLEVRRVLNRYAFKLPTVLARYVASSAGSPESQRPLGLIVRTDPEATDAVFALRQRLASDRRIRQLPLINGFQVQLTPSEVVDLLPEADVEYVTLDLPVRSAKTASPDPGPYLQGLKTAIGADQAGGTRRSITVAVFDSGASLHRDLQTSLEFDEDLIVVDLTRGKTNVRVNRIELDDEDSLEELKRSGAYDDFGHGTHVAGIIAGSGKDFTNKKYQLGVAPNARILNVKVLGAQGWGYTSHLIRAIQWVIDHRFKYKIRVANLSLGHPPIESYRNDPLCRAVRSMVEAGIVTVVSAGNLGKTREFPRIWGGITSPGIEPSVITVGAVNTRGTPSHCDDIATTYSSRGPTIDGVFKPDLVAPGNAVPSALAPDSWFALHFPEYTVADSYVRLSGSSMATAFVTGTVTRMLAANPRLNPQQIKLILLLTAVKMEQPALFEQGNGLLNAKTAIDLAAAINVKRQKLKRKVAPCWFIGSEQVCAGGAFVLADQVVYDPLAGSNVGNFWGSGLAWEDGLEAFDSNGVFWADSQGVFWSDARGVFWTDSTGVFWSDAVSLVDGISWLESEGVFWSDARGVFWTDALLPSCRGLNLATFSGDQD